MLDFRYYVQTTNPLNRLDTIYIPFIIKALIARNVHRSLKVHHYGRNFKMLSKNNETFLF